MIMRDGEFWTEVSIVALGFLPVALIIWLVF